MVAGDALKPPVAPAAAGLVFLDPPYGQGLLDPVLPALTAAGWMAAGSWVVAELGKTEAWEPPATLELLDQRRYGAARLLFLRCPGL